ncbi:MAG: tRNA 2-thiocytidine biosynthesis TtcA family protein [Prevotella sp.]|nr:tRNA 2-thiocytidine biosynthesis TtcA family protein [Prevotellaceae bacterium]MDY5251086.1 tRNA 2-thiocytidine biosynthesis TtcA family protein [Prevotella sp.]
MPKPTEEDILLRRISRRFQKALTDYHLIQDADRILVGLSGGKDSLCLLEMLARRRRILKPSFDVEAVHVRMDNIRYETDLSYLEQFTSDLGIRLHIVNTGFEYDESKVKPRCFLCSWQRRKQMFNLAQELGFNKIALGHHQDDIIHTAMMNIFFQGHFSTMPASLTMKKMPITIIRPLCLVAEKDIRLLADLHHYQKLIKICPYETDSHRADMADMFAKIEKMNPEARYSVWNALESEGKLME